MTTQQPVKRRGNTPQSPERMQWDGAMFDLVEQYGVTRSDAQSIVEAAETMLDKLFEAGVSPELATVELMK